jgi:hypothetical protein
VQFQPLSLLLDSIKLKQLYNFQSPLWCFHSPIKEANPNELFNRAHPTVINLKTTLIAFPASKGTNDKHICFLARSLSFLAFFSDLIIGE